jgi:hypothetical protein
MNDTLKDHVMTNEITAFHQPIRRETLATLSRLHFRDRAPGIEPAATAQEALSRMREHRVDEAREHITRAISQFDGSVEALTGGGASYSTVVRYFGNAYKKLHDSIDASVAGYAVAPLSGAVFEKSLNLLTKEFKAGVARLRSGAEHVHTAAPMSSGEWFKTVATKLEGLDAAWDKAHAQRDQERLRTSFAM